MAQFKAAVLPTPRGSDNGSPQRDKTAERSGANIVLFSPFSGRVCPAELLNGEAAPVPVLSIICQGLIEKHPNSCCTWWSNQRPWERIHTRRDITMHSLCYKNVLSGSVPLHVASHDYQC